MPVPVRPSSRLPSGVPARPTAARSARWRAVGGRRGATVLVAAALVLGGTGTASAATLGASVAADVVTSPPPAAVPAEPAGLPAGVEDPSPYLKQVSCDPRPLPGATALSALLLATYPGTSAGIGRACGADGIASEHYEGRAVDWMTSVRDPQGAARAEALVGWLLAPDAAGHAFANARRLGLMYVIWNNRIWGSYAAASGWRPYSTCAAHPDAGWDTSCHRNHVHLSLSWAGASGRTSFWTGHVAPTDYGPCRPADLNWAAPYSGPNGVPCPSYGAIAARAGTSAVTAALVRYSGATVGPGSTGPVVGALQAALGVTADGQFGDLTAAAAAAFRVAHGLPAGHQVDAAMWRALLAAAPASSPAPTPGAASGAAPGAAGASGSGGASGPVTAGGSASAAAPAPASARPALSYGSTGEAVLVVQRALHVTPVSGWFGPVTRTAVAAFQTGRGLPVTGVVDPATWAALGR